MELKKIKLQYIIIDNDNSGKRIDNFLISQFKNLPKSLIYRILRKGNIRINKKRVKPKYKLQFGDKLKIPSVHININKDNIIPLNLKKISKLNDYIIYEDNFFLVLNKPSGIAVHGGSGLNFGIIEGLRILRPKNKYLELVHRLDRETSGVLLIAKKRSALLFLHKQLREKKIHKQYLAIVHGHWPKKIKTVKLPLLKIIKKYEKNVVCVNKNGKLSETKFIIQEIYKSCTLLKVTPITGRTHQIRLHTQNIGYPIIFDKKYGNNKLDNYLNIEKDNLNRLCLHAESISFIHPESRKKIYFNASIDEKFKYYLKILRQEII